MREFQLHKYSAMAYEKNQILSFSERPLTGMANVDEAMKSCTGVSSIQVSDLTQEEFDYFVQKYGDNFESIYFFQNRKVKDVSALSMLRKVKCLLFYNVGGAGLWDMRQNENLKGVFISDSKRMLYDLGQLQYAPELEELILLSTTFCKYSVKTIDPLQHCKKLKRLFMDFNTEDNSFRPENFEFLDVFQYQCDKKRNFTF